MKDLCLIPRANTKGAVQSLTCWVLYPQIYNYGAHFAHSQASKEPAEPMEKSHLLSTASLLIRHFPRYTQYGACHTVMVTPFEALPRHQLRLVGAQGEIMGIREQQALTVLQVLVPLPELRDTPNTSRALQH